MAGPLDGAHRSNPTVDAMSDDAPMRLQRFLALAGVASRRRAEELIVAGRVRVDGVVVRTLGTTVTPNARVECDRRAVVLPATQTYIILHKPIGVMTTLHDPEGRRTIADLIRAAGVKQRVVPVGRLDYDTSGILLLTDDGALAHVLTHPSFGVEKLYRAVIRGRVLPGDVAALSRGVSLDDGRAAPVPIRVVASRPESTTVDVTLREGRNREVRRIFEELGHPVLGLTRLRFGPLGLGDLRAGALREPTPRELSSLRRTMSEVTMRSINEKGRP